MLKINMFDWDSSMLGTAVLEKLKKKKGRSTGTSISTAEFQLRTEDLADRYTIELSANVQLWVFLEETSLCKVSLEQVLMLEIEAFGP